MDMDEVQEVCQVRDVMMNFVWNLDTHLGKNHELMQRILAYNAGQMSFEFC